MRRWTFLLAVAACGGGREPAKPAPADAAPPRAPEAPFRTTRVEGVSGTAYFTPDGSFWVQDTSGEEMVHLGLDGKELGRLPLDEETALWIRTSRVRRPVLPLAM